MFDLGRLFKRADTIRRHLAAPVKRHSKLTPWRQRKLTPEETAYVDRLPAVHRVP